MHSASPGFLNKILRRERAVFEAEGGMAVKEQVVSSK